MAVLSAVVGMVALPAACFALRSVGPATHVVFYDYLPLEELAGYGFAMVVGAARGAGVPGWLRARTSDDPPRRAPRARLLALVLVAAWVLLPQLRAFPAGASIAEREAWARARVRYFPALAQIAASLPMIAADVGRVRAIAPTARDEHVFAREMNGDDVRFTLDVVGERGSGILHIDCTLDEQRIYDWRSAHWAFGGRRVAIERPAPKGP